MTLQECQIGNRVLLPSNLEGIIQSITFCRVVIRLNNRSSLNNLEKEEGDIENRRGRDYAPATECSLIE